LEAGRLTLGSVATGSGSHESFVSATVSADNIALAIVGGEMKTEGVPRFVGNNVASVMRAVGPKEVNFARYSLDYHLLRNYLHVSNYDCKEVLGDRHIV
jgi:hypothetical protein